MTEGSESIKRRRLAIDDSHSHPRNIVEKDMFYVTFNSYGTIQLLKVALQKYPSSLISETFLGDDTVNEDNRLYVPIGCGLRSFPDLIQEIYDGGSPSRIPELGLDFDLFYKWLRYLGLATSRRSLSIETEAAKRVSHFVEMFINTLNIEYVRIGRNEDDVETRLSVNDLVCVELHPDIARYRHNLLPFEFARRGMFMTIRQLDKQQMEFPGVWDLSTLQFGTIGRHYLPDDGGFRLPLPCSETRVPPGTVVNAFKSHFSAEEEAGVTFFTHRRCKYMLSIDEGLEGEDGTAKLERRERGCSADNGDIREDVILCSSRDDLVRKFHEGGMMYSREEYGVSFIAQNEMQRVGGRTFQADMPLVSGMTTSFHNEHRLRRDAYILIVASEEEPILKFKHAGTYLEEYDGDAWGISIDQSPEWALCTDGLAS